MSLYLFCGAPADGAPVEHLLPESLGGGDWATLPSGIVCGGCNRYFGSHIEGPALASFPFLPIRVFSGIVSKRGRYPATPVVGGSLRGTDVPGLLDLDPPNENRTVARILAVVTEPLAVARLLLKMGIELIASQSVEEARASRYAAARAFVRAPRLGTSWWFLTHYTAEHLQALGRGGSGQPPKVSTVEITGVEMVEFAWSDLEIHAPLDPRVPPPSLDGFPEPWFTLTVANVKRGGR